MVHLSLYLLFLSPLVSAGVHRLKLQKLSPSSLYPELESAFFAEKYASQSQSLMGAGGQGHRISFTNRNDGGLDTATQENLKDGHGVPLESICSPHRHLSAPNNTIPVRLLECPVLHGDHPRFTASKGNRLLVYLHNTCSIILFYTQFKVVLDTG